MKKVVSVVLCVVMVLSVFTSIPVGVSADDVDPLETDISGVVQTGKTAADEREYIYPTGGYMPDIAQTGRSVEEETALALAAEKLLTDIKGNDHLNAVEKSLLVHDRLAAWVDYDYYTLYKTEKYDADSYTKYGALLKHKAVCGGYADAYSYLMNKIGIKTEYVGSEELDHGWNIVVINNKPYYVDVTWDDCHMNYIEHDNFLRSYDGFVKTGHTASDYSLSYNGTPINDTTYDEYYWQDSYSEFLLAEYRSEYKIYYFDHVKGELRIANDNHRVIYTVPDDIFAGKKRCTYLCRTNDAQLFSYSDKVYKIDPRTDSVITNEIIAGLDKLNIGKLEGIIEDEKGGSVDDISWEMTGSVLTIKNGKKLGDHYRLKENGYLDHYCCLPPVIKKLARTVILPDGAADIPGKMCYMFTGLKSIVIPDGVQSIGNYAFYNCTGLEQVVIPDSVKSIGEYAFYNCTGLTKIKIGKGVQSIGSYAFSKCSALNEVDISDIAAWFKVSFDDDYYSNPLYNAKKLYSNGKLITDLVIPSGVTSIPDYAFYNIETIKSVTIPDSVKTIGDYAFYNCTGLTKVKIGKGVQSIGKYAFYNCAALSEVDISDVAAWFDVSFADSYYNSNPVFFAKKLYSNGKLITDLVIPSGVTSIPDYAFYNIETIKSVTIPDSVKTIGNYAFNNCTGLIKVTIGKGIQSIGISSFYNCPALNEVDISDIAAWFKVSFADDYYSNPIYYAKKLYSNGKLLTDLVIPSGVKSVPVRAFYGIESLKSVTIPDSVKTIGEYAFYNCTGLTKVAIGKGVQSIGKYAFYNCSALNELDVSDLAAWLKISFVDSYYSNPLSYAKKMYLNGYPLTDLVIPSGVTSISDYALYGVDNLKSVTIPDGVKTIGNSAFYGCTGLTKVAIGKGVQSIGNYAFGGCYEIDYLYVPACVKTIGKDALPYFCDIYGKKGSAAEKYAQDNQKSFTPIGDEVAGETGSWSWNLDEDLTLTIKGKGKTDSYLKDTGEYYYIENTPWGSRVKKAVIESGITRLGDFAMHDCTELESVTIAKSVKYIGDYAFSGCSALSEIVIPDGVTEIGRGAFEECGELTKVTIGKGVKSIDSSAFIDCKNLKSVTVPANVTEIGWMALGYTIDPDSYSSEKIKGFTIRGYADTEAQRYAEENGFMFVDLAPQPAVILGDADGDGKVTVMDASLIQHKLVGLNINGNFNDKAADVDKNGELEVIDATYILRYAAKLQTPYKVGEAIA